MRILIDADGCPVVRLTVDCAARHGVSVIIVCDSAHLFELPGAETVVVDKGADSTDFYLANLIRPGDIAVTQDYGLAAMCLARGARAISQNGLHYTDRNIDSLLMARHASRRLRTAGVRVKGPPKRTAQQDEDFLKALEKLILS